jgi:hypothetical protein
MEFIEQAFPLLLGQINCYFYKDLAAQDRPSNFLQDVKVEEIHFLAPAGWVMTGDTSVLPLLFCFNSGA